MFLTAAGVVFIMLMISSCNQKQGTLAPSTFDGLNGPVQTIAVGGYSINNWEPDPYSIYNNETLALNTNAAYVEEGTGSAQVYCNPLSSTEPISLYKDFSYNNANLTNRIVSIWMYVPANLAVMNTSYFLDLYLTINGGGTKEIYSRNQYPATAGWTQISFKTPTDTEDYNYVSAVKFTLEDLVNQNPQPFTGYIYFDEISW